MTWLPDSDREEERERWMAEALFGTDTASAAIASCRICGAGVLHTETHCFACGTPRGQREVGE